MIGPSNDKRMDTGASCPDPEALAAWLDQGVGGDEHKRIVQHLAGCDECRVIVAHVLETRTAVRDAHDATSAARADVTTATPAGKRLAWVWASVLTAAAVLTVSLVSPQWGRWGAGSIDSKLADLAAAVGSERTVEARLTGGFDHRPLRAAVRSGGSLAAPDNWALFAAAGKIREDAERDPNAENLHALGLAYLVLGQHDEAVRALEDAVAEASQIARYQSDLAAAYLARARALDRPDDLPQALGAAERAIKADEKLIEARFNRALALEALYLSDQARAAWDDYLSLDATSAWATEARERLQKLQQSAASRESARNNSPPLISETTVEAGLNWLLRFGLPTWADLIAANDTDAAARAHLSLANYAQQLSAASEDALPIALVERARVAAGDARFLAQVRQIGAALRKLDEDDVAGAETDLRPVCTDATAPWLAICDVELAMIDVVRRDDAAAERRHATASVVPGLYVQGRAARVAGFRRLHKGDFVGAGDHYQRAHTFFADGKYLQQAANMASQIADAYDLTGASATAWRWRERALRLVDVLESPTLRQGVYMSTAARLAARGAYETSYAFNRAAQAESRGVPARRLASTLDHVRTALASGDLAVADDGLRAAEILLAESTEFRAHRMRVDVLALRGSIEAHKGDLAAAERSLSEALATITPERARLRLTTVLERARVRTALARLDDAERDVRDAIALLRASESTTESIKLVDATTAFHAVADLVTALPESRHREGLFLAEQLRELIDRVAAPQRISSPDAFDKLVSLSDGHAAVFFLFGQRALLTWIVIDNRIQFVRRPIDARQVDRMTAALSVGVNRGATESVIREGLSDLYDLLLRDLPDIRGARALLLIPDGPLNRVPFGALYDRSAQRYVFQSTTVRVAPNLALGLRKPAVRRPASVLAIGNPTLHHHEDLGLAAIPGALAEARAVATLYPERRLLVGDQATKENVIADLATANVVHYAGHAMPADTRGPARLLLAGSPRDPRTALTAADLSTGMHDIVVVLAGCETARDSSESTSGAASLAAAFLRTGASSTVATLWKVDDDASAELFVSLHRALIAGQPPAVAVALAQQECFTNAECRSAPANWIGIAAYGLH